MARLSAGTKAVQELHKETHQAHRERTQNVGVVPRALFVDAPGQTKPRRRAALVAEVGYDVDPERLGGLLDARRHGSGKSMKQRVTALRSQNDRGRGPHGPSADHGFQIPAAAPRH